MENLKQSKFCYKHPTGLVSKEDCASVSHFQHVGEGVVNLPLSNPLIPNIVYHK